MYQLASRFQKRVYRKIDACCTTISRTRATSLSLSPLFPFALLKCIKSPSYETLVSPRGAAFNEEITSVYKLTARRFLGNGGRHTRDDRSTIP